MNQVAHSDQQLQSAKTLTLILYILYILGIFTAGILAVIALIINYVKRSDMDGTWLASHFTWQIKTFWWYLIWNIIAIIPFTFLIFTENNPDLFAGVALTTFTIWVVIAVVSWIWIVYRAIKGLLYLNDNKAIY